jgi:pilus assembly protein CpaE
MMDSLQHAPPLAVILDLDPAPVERLAWADRILAHDADMPVIALADSGGDDLVYRAMETGVRYLLRKRRIPARLGAALERLVSPSPGPQAAGAVTTVLSASGGCGATTIAVNLANELQLENSRATLLVDLDPAYGAVATYLGLHGEFGVADVLARDDGIDAELIRSTTSGYSETMDALISPVSVAPDRPARLNYANLEAMLDACKSAYAHTVIDAPRVHPEIAARLARASRATLLVFQLNVKDLRLAKAMLRGLIDNGVEPGRILPCASRYKKRAPMITLSDGTAMLGCESVEWVSNDYRNAIRSLNFGQLLNQVAPRSSLRRDVQRLATKVSHNGTAGGHGAA